MSSEINKINSGTPQIDLKVFEKNLQQMGRQTDMVKKKDVEDLASARDTLDFHDKFRGKDQVDITKEGQKAAQHSGVLQELADDKKITKKEKAEDTRKAKAAKTDEDIVGLKKTIKDAGEASKSREAAIPPPPDFNAAAAKAGPEPAAPEQAQPIGKTPAGGATPAEEGSTPPATGPATESAERFKATQDDLGNASKIFMQMAADRQKWFADIMKIFADVQTHIMETIQDVLANRAAAMDRINEKWTKVMRGTY